MKIFLLVLLMIAGLGAFAQTAQKFSAFNVGLETSFPFAKASASYKTGIGASLKYEYRADSNFFLSISAGYINFGLTDAAKAAFINYNGSHKSSIGFLPIKIGGKFYISKGFFGEVQLGNTFAVNDNRLESAAASMFTVSPGVGYVFDSGLEFGVRYEGWFTSGFFSQYGLRLGYRFR